MDIDSYDHVEIERNGAASNSDRYITPHLLRHITRIQVRNFTPFPTRDAIASALTQPSEQSQFTSYGSLSDDLDVALARKRARRVSSTSIISVKSQGLEDQANEESRTVSSMLLAEQRVRKRTISRASAREFSTGGGSGSHPPLSGTVISPKSIRPRTTSAMTSTSGKGTVPITLWQSYTQKSLEKVLQSRLVETLITVSVPSTVEQSASPMKPSRSASPSFRDRQSSPRASPAMKSKLHSPYNSTSRSTLGSREEQSARRISRTGATMATEGPTPTPASPNPRQGRPETRNVPNFISDPSATHMTVRLWARLPPDSPNLLGNEKGKDKVSEGISDPQWRMAGTWDICLADLVPVPDEMSEQPSTLPSNALLVTLFPPGKTFYLPVVRSLGPTRSPSPSSGYNSDPEIHTSGNPLASRSAAPRRKEISLPKSRQSRAEYAASSTWQNLVKLVNLQSAIIDTRRSLSKVVKNLDALYVPSEVNWLIREISERERRVADWQTAEAQVRVEADNLSERIRHRKELLKRRRDALSLATDALEQDVTAEAITEQELLRERESAMALQRRVLPIRASLITTLASLFPIDLISGSDLLFSILDVPLPIPVGVTDPAPPLSLPTHKEVNEEGVATALAYAAFVVQFLATYLDKMLRSMIRDGISAMVGPRMFPLFARGVDTYRFEYGVFLLNKNIEMLMSDRNLRALDMRHTLPNLKNLLLTLSDEEGAQSSPAG
ncbi:hypothetical protein BGY98DRAFT_941490 [Russula aff. rugulosa BPL654]|nr:hypothetical protein BGY98DRAFT_941490 [Russula aff. rugulosa BPL654]